MSSSWIAPVGRPPASAGTLLGASCAAIVWLTTCLSHAEAATPTSDVCASAPTDASARSSGDDTLIIRSGGSFTGSWCSDDPDTPAVTVATTEPVYLHDCRLSGRGHLIRSVTPGSNITVRDCHGRGLDAGRAGVGRGRFVAVFRPGRLTVENNLLVSTAGIYVDGGGMSADHIAIRFNRADNVDGRLSNGAGGLTSDAVKVQFVQLNNLRHAASVSVSWNQVVNEPGLSRVEDIISVHRSSGTERQPIRIENNFLQGAYAARPQVDAYSGGGIIADGSADRAEHTSGYVVIAHNQVLATSNHGIAVAAGVHVSVLNNRLFSTGKLPDGASIRAANVGIYVWDVYAAKPKGAFGSHVVSGNRTAWWNHKGERNDHWFADCQDSVCGSNVSAPGAPDSTAYDDEWRVWQARLKQANVRIGPRTGP